ncbi:MAG: MoaD/ThiS family protein [Promethearchaeati archaeon]
MSVENIKVTVKFFANLQKYGPEKSTEYFPMNSTVNDILEKYDIPKNEMKLIILINGKPHQTEKTSLKEGDIVAIFPPLAGG